MLGKLAIRNTKRSLNDYLIYLITITISFSLILAFNLVASSDKVVELSSGMDSFKNALTFVNVIIVFVVCFLINYTTRFMFEKRSKEFGTYMLLGIKKKDIVRLLVIENILLGIFAFVLAIPLGLVFSQFVSLVIVKLLVIPKVIFISVNLASIGLLAIYFLAIYVLVLLNLLRRIRRMTVHDFLYFDKQNEKKMFSSSRKRNVIFVISMILGIASLFLWNSRFNLDKFSQRITFTYLVFSMMGVIISIYGIYTTSADMMLSVLLKSNQRKYQKDTLFVSRAFASKARTMSFTFGTLSMLILLSLLCLNFSIINKGASQTSIELTTPYDVQIFDDKRSFDEYIRVIEENYTIKDTVEYDVYKENKAQIQQYLDIQYYDFDPVIKLSDYNRLLEMRNMDPITLQENEYYIVANNEASYKLEKNENIKNIELSNEKNLILKGIDTKSFSYSMFNTGYFVIVIPDNYTQSLNVSENHLVVDTEEETTTSLREKIINDMQHQLIKTNKDGKEIKEYFRIGVRGFAIEEQNSMTGMIASICLYIAIILLSVVGTILAIQSLSDATKYKCRYLTLRRLGVNDKSLFKTIRKQLYVLFGYPVIYSIISSFCMITSINNMSHVILESEYIYLLYFVSSLVIFLIIYVIYWIATYIGFKRNINAES